MKNGFDFTLVMITVGILGIILAVVIPNINRLENNANNMKTPIESYNVRFLFETNGIKVYKFIDKDIGNMWHPVYFTDVRGKIEWESTSGKVNRDNGVEMVGE